MMRLELLNFTGRLPVFVNLTWKSAVVGVELNHSKDIVICSWAIELNDNKNINKDKRVTWNENLEFKSRTW